MILSSIPKQKKNIWTISDKICLPTPSITLKLTKCHFFKSKTLDMYSPKKAYHLYQRNKLHLNHIPPHQNVEELREFLGPTAYTEAISIILPALFIH